MDDLKKEGVTTRRAGDRSASRVATRRTGHEPIGRPRHRRSCLRQPARPGPEQDPGPAERPPPREQRDRRHRARPEHDPVRRARTSRSPARRRFLALRHRRGRRRDQLHHPARLHRRMFAPERTSPQHPAARPTTPTSPLAPAISTRTASTSSASSTIKSRTASAPLSVRPHHRSSRPRRLDLPGPVQPRRQRPTPALPGLRRARRHSRPARTSGNDHTCGYLYARFVDLIPNTRAHVGAAQRHVEDLRRTCAAPRVLRHRVEQRHADRRRSLRRLDRQPGDASTTRATASRRCRPFTLTRPTSRSSLTNQASSGFIKLRWRDQVNGGRAEQTDNTQQRLVAAIQGSIIGWDYKVGASYNENNINDNLIGGYTDGNHHARRILNGIINPFGATGRRGSGLLLHSAAGQRHAVHRHRARSTTLDAQGQPRTRRLVPGAGRPAASRSARSSGTRRSRIVGNPPFDQLVISSTGFDPATDNEGSRNVAARLHRAERSDPQGPRSHRLHSLRPLQRFRQHHQSEARASATSRCKQLLFRGSDSTGFPGAFAVST